MIRTFLKKKITFYSQFVIIPSKVMKFKRYCKTLSLKNDPNLIKQYVRIHGKDAVWPEITQGMKEVGILDMEIYIYENKLFMIMDTKLDFNHDKAMDKLARLPRQTEWELYVSKFQDTDDASSAKGKWQLMERIFKLEEKDSYEAIDGQVEIIGD